jgi:hypothetical protein
MTDSYAMIDPINRFFGNTGGVHHVGLSIREAGALDAPSVGRVQERQTRQARWDLPMGASHLMLASRARSDGRERLNAVRALRFR